MAMESNILLRIPNKEWKKAVAKHAKNQQMSLSTYIRVAVMRQIEEDILRRRNPAFLEEKEPEEHDM